MKRKHKTLVVVTYDIQNDRNRTKLAELLETQGTRVNLSVFECVLTAAELTKLKGQLPQFMDEGIDKVILYEICLDCYLNIERLGPSTESPVVCRVF
jgi:CRISPR-associated protein Cas2